MRNSRERTSATKTNEVRDKEEVSTVGQGELYSPDHALKISKPSEISDSKTKEEKTSDNPEEENKKGKMVAVNLRGIKEKVLEKLAAASVPSDALDNAKLFLEGVVRDFAVAAQGLTKDALHRIKTHLIDVLPSLSPAVTRKMVDDAEKEANKEAEQQEHSSDNQLMTPASSLFASLAKPFSRL